MTAASQASSNPIPRALVMAAVFNTVWVNASEILRYFAFIQGLMRQALPGVPDVAPMNLPVFLSWGVWDTILVIAVTGFTWLYLDRFGNSMPNAAGAGTLVWLSIFVIVWLGLFNMNLATPQILLTALPLAWLEMVVAALIVDWCRQRYPG